MKLESKVFIEKIFEYLLWEMLDFLLKIVIIMNKIIGLNVFNK